MIFRNSKTHENADQLRNNKTVSDRIAAGLDRFLTSLFVEQTVLFDNFLELSGEHFDKLIIETTQQEHLHYIGGKLIFTPELAPDNVSQPCTIRLTANLYFLNKQKNWIVKTTQKYITANSIKDWNDAPELEELRAGNPIEFSIDPPNKEE